MFVHMACFFLMIVIIRIFTGRERSTWCKWNSRIPRMSRSKRC